MLKTISLEPEDEPDYEDRLVFQMVSDMFDVDIEFSGLEVAIFGIGPNVIAWVAFHLLPMEVGEA